MTRIEINLTTIIKQAIKKAFPEIPDRSSEGLLLETPKEKKFGDFSSNIAMKLSRELKKPPMDIAAGILKCVEKTGIIQDVKIEKPGFINLYISRKAAAEAQGYHRGRRIVRQVFYWKREKDTDRICQREPNRPAHSGAR